MTPPLPRRLVAINLTAQDKWNYVQWRDPT